MDAGAIAAIGTYCAVGVLIVLLTAYLMRKRKGMLSPLGQTATWGAVAGYFVWYGLLLAIASTPGLWSFGALFFIFFLSALCALPTAYLHYQYSQSVSSTIMMVIGGAIMGLIAYPVFIARHLWTLYKAKPPPKLSAPEGAKEETEVSKEDLEKEA